MSEGRGEKALAAQRAAALFGLSQRGKAISEEDVATQRDFQAASYHVTASSSLSHPSTTVTGADINLLDIVLEKGIIPPKTLATDIGIQQLLRGHMPIDLEQEFVNGQSPLTIMLAKIGAEVNAGHIIIQKRSVSLPNLIIGRKARQFTVTLLEDTEDGIHTNYGSILVQIAGFLKYIPDSCYEMKQDTLSIELPDTVLGKKIAEYFKTHIKTLNRQMN